MDIFTKFKSTIKIRQIQVDNEVFQLHYRVTALILMVSGALVASKQHFGNPINCITRDDVPEKIMDTYCWVHATFTIPKACNSSSFEVPHPCIGTFLERPYDRESEKERVYHSYYQWVYFVLFFQAVCFYLPHFYWKNQMSKLLSWIVTDLKNPLKPDEKEKLSQIVDYFVRYNKLYPSHHESYLKTFFLCEFANLVNVLLQIGLVNWFLGGMFTSYGFDVFNRLFESDEPSPTDPMELVFPKVTKCSFRRFGPSGDVNKYDALCILPLNILNEKIYIIMWTWFVVLAFITLLWIIYRCLLLGRPKFRHRVLQRSARLAKPQHLAYVLKKVKVGDWFLLMMMSKNMDQNSYKCFTSSLADKLREEENSQHRKRKNRKYSGREADSRNVNSPSGPSGFSETEDEEAGMLGIAIDKNNDDS